MSKQSPLIQYTKKGPPYVKTGGNHDELSDPTTSDAFSGASERCSVKGCTNTFATQPPKIFVPFPTQPSKRTRWLKVIGIDPEHPPSHKLFCCEDHFDLKRDVMHLSTLRSANSGIVPNLLKDTVVPHIHTNRNVAVESQVNSSAGYRTPLDEQMQVFLTQKTSDTDPLSSSSAECVVKDEPDPDPISAPLPRIRVKSSHELMISSTSSFSEPPKSQTRPPESRKMQRTSVIHKPLTSLTPISVIRSNPQTPNTSATPGTVDKYRECAVQGCPYNLRTFPNISLVYVPIHESFRKAWYKAIGRAYTRRSSQENIYVCSSHFNEDQLEVVMPPGTPGARRSNHTFKRAKPGVLPSINLDLSSKAGEVQATPPLHSMMDQLPRVPDLTPHSPSALMSGSVNLQVPPAAKSHAQSLSAPQHVVSPRVDKDSSLPASSKPVTPVQPRCQKYVAKSMPQYPDCKHKPEEEYQCKDLSVVDCSTFYSQFHSLETRDEQNGFIFAHTEMIASSSQEPEQPVFKFFMEQKKSHGVTRRIQVCAHAFSTCLSFEITALISLVTRHFDTIQPRSDSKPSLVLKSVKMEEASDEDDVMMYESAPAIVEIEDSPDEEKVDIKIEIFEAMPGPSKETEVESDVNRPLTVEEELRQTVRDVFEGFRTSGLPDEPENMECDSEHVPKIEPNAFESVHICKRCLAQFITKAAFEEHVNEVGSCNQFMGEFFKCSTCGRTLTSFEDLKVHTNVYHKYVCPKCSDTFRYRRYLEDHVVKCTGTNRLTDDMMRLINRIKVMQHKIANSRKKGSMVFETIKTEVDCECVDQCSVVLHKLKLPVGKENFKLELLDIEKTEIEEIPRLKIKAATGSAANSVVSSPVRRNSSPVDTERDSRRSPTPLDPEIEEEVDVESVCQTETGEKRRKPENPMKKSKRSMSSSSEEEVVRKHPRRGRPWARERSSRSVQNSSPTNAPPTTRALRARKPINLKEIDADSDSEPIPELANLSGGESDVDPDFDPSTEFKRGRKRGRKMSSSSESCSENETRSSKVSTGCSSNSSVAGSVSCSQCKASYANISGLRAHHRLSEKCGKFPPGTIFRCSDCSKMFISQSMLDAHHSENLCQKSLRTPTPTNSNPSKASSTTSERRPHNLATGPHVCKCCKVVFNSALGMGLHLKRSQKCIADNPEVDLPGVVNKTSSEDNSSGPTKKIATDQADKKTNQDMVFICVKCFSSFSSVWGLRTHERNSVECKPDRPYEIPVPIPKDQAEKQKREYLEKQKKSVKEDHSDPPPDSSTGTDARKPKQGFMMVYTQESQVEDGKFKCKSCCALFTSVWGLRTHQRMSEGCLDKNKIILSDAAAKSIANGENICPNCAAKFSTSWGLRTHLRTSSLCSENETDVKGCDSRKNEDVTITKNGRVQPGAGCYLCPQCPKTFKLPFSLEQHFVEHAPQKDDWRCHLCTNDFADQFTMHRHFHREHLGKWFCIMCEKKCVLNSFTDFYAHIFDQHASDPGNSKKYFKCPICFKSFISKFSYDFHVASCKKLAEQVFTCASCQKVFNKKIHITNHMKYAHTGVVIDERYKFKCPRCPRKFLSEKDYRQKHEKESCIQEEMPCEICGEMYRGFDKLKVHIEIAHKKRSELHSGKKSPLPGRKSSDPGSRSPLPEKKAQEPSKAETIISSSCSSPAVSSLSSSLQDSPASPEANIPSVKIEKSSP